MCTTSTIKLKECSNIIFHLGTHTHTYTVQDDNFENPARANLVNELEPSTDTSVLSSLPLEEGTNSDSSRGYMMGPILKAMLEEWDKGDELLIKSKKKRRKAKEKEKEPVLQAEEDFFY